MLRPRVVVCLDVKDGRVVKGTRFENLRNVGDPVELAARYEAEGADEIVFLDVSASKEQRSTLLDVVRRTAERLFIPLTVGGGVRNVDDIGPVLRAGADKISVNTAAVQNPEVISTGAERFGSQCIVASIDAASEENRWRCYTHGGSKPTELDAVAWASECVRRGAGEILLTSIDHDGGRSGYELNLTRAVSDAVSVPVIASGGAGASHHLRDAFTEGGASAALVAGILHDRLTTVRELKDDLISWGIDVRRSSNTMELHQ
jgi:cyclase